MADEGACGKSMFPYLLFLLCTSLLFSEPDTIVVLVSSIGGPLVTVLLVTVAAATSLPGERNIQVLAFRDLDGTLSSWHCDFVTL